MATQSERHSEAEAALREPFDPAAGEIVREPRKATVVFLAPPPAEEGFTRYDNVDDFIADLDVS